MMSHLLLQHGCDFSFPIGTSGQGAGPEIVRMTACINFYGVQDLREILQHVMLNKDVGLKGCRPTRVQHYLQAGLELHYVLSSKEPTTTKYLL